jgi:DNA-binding transcriptional LysR family regulator
MWETIELRELRVFLTLAEELHFGRSAERLGLTQSRVSQSLRELEAKLGGRLVYRTSRRVELTPLGERFLADAGPVYGKMTDVLRQTHAASGAIAGTLNVEQVGVSGAQQLLALIDAFKGRHPDCDVEVRPARWDDPFGALRRGEANVMTSWLPLEQPDLVVGPVLSSEPRVLAVAHDHALARKAAVSIEDLAGCRIPRFEGMPPELLEMWTPSRTPSGRAITGTPIDQGEAVVTNLAMRIAHGELVHPTVPSVAAYMGDLDIVYVPIADMPPMRSALVWRRRDRDPRLRAFIRVAREELKRGHSTAIVRAWRVPTA